MYHSDIAKDFAREYYNSLLIQTNGSKALYAVDAVLNHSSEGQKNQIAAETGAAAVAQMHKLYSGSKVVSTDVTSVPFGVSRIVVSISGESSKKAESKPHSFTQMFILSRGNRGNYRISMDIMKSMQLDVVPKLTESPKTSSASRSSNGHSEEASTEDLNGFRTRSNSRSRSRSPMRGRNARLSKNQKQHHDSQSSLNDSQLAPPSKKKDDLAKSAGPSPTPASPSSSHAGFDWRDESGDYQKKANKQRSKSREYKSQNKSTNEPDTDGDSEKTGKPANKDGVKADFSKPNKETKTEGKEKTKAENGMKTRSKSVSDFKEQSEDKDSKTTSKSETKTDAKGDKNEKSDKGEKPEKAEKTEKSEKTNKKQEKSKFDKSSPKSDASGSKAAKQDNDQSSSSGKSAEPKFKFTVDSFAKASKFQPQHSNSLSPSIQSPQMAVPNVIPQPIPYSHAQMYSYGYPAMAFPSPQNVMMGYRPDVVAPQQISSPHMSHHNMRYPHQQQQPQQQQFNRGFQPHRPYQNHGNYQNKNQYQDQPDMI